MRNIQKNPNRLNARAPFFLNFQKMKEWVLMGTESIISTLLLCLRKCGGNRPAVLMLAILSITTAVSWSAAAELFQNGKFQINSAFWVFFAISPHLGTKGSRNMGIVSHRKTLSVWYKFVYLGIFLTGHNYFEAEISLLSNWNVSPRTRVCSLIW